MSGEKEPLLDAVHNGDDTGIVDDPDKVEAKKADDLRKSRLLIFSFVMMVIVGLGNKIFQKLQTVPMQEYPFFLSLLTTFIYIPTSFAYIIPMMKWGKQITREQQMIPKYKFAIMGLLDGIAGVMQVFAVTYISSGGLIILLMQSAIPISMIITRVMLKTVYKVWHYIGSVIVLIGIGAALLPLFIPELKPEPYTTTTMAPGTPAPTAFSIPEGVWIGVLLASCIPMALSSVYKEKALGEADIDVVYLNGWVAVFQALVTLVFAIPSGYAQSPPISYSELPANIVNGFKCYIGRTVAGAVVDCSDSPLFVNIYMGFNILYNIFIIFILKYGSSNILYLAMTIMVPLGNVAFALKFVPQARPMSALDIVGLLVILFGLVIYRFSGPIIDLYNKRKQRSLNGE